MAMASAPAPIAARCGLPHLLFVELDEHTALRIHALANFKAQRSFDQRLVFLKKQIVGFRAIDTADFINVAKALGGQQRTT